MMLKDLLLELEMPDLAAALEPAKGTRERVLLLGTDGRDLLSLLEGLGVEGPLGERALDCPVICADAEAFSAEIVAGERRVSCPDRMALTVYLREREPDYLRLELPSPLLRERELVFLPLREEDLELRMLRYAASCQGAIAVLPASGSPSGALFGALDWLRAVRALPPHRFAALFNHCEAAFFPNRSTLAPVQIALGASEPPRCFDAHYGPNPPEAQSPAQALGLALDAVCGGAEAPQDEAALERRIAALACERLEGRVRELEARRPAAPKEPGTPLSEIFMASARLQSYRMDEVVTQETADLFIEELTGFTLYFRSQLRDILRGALELDHPKDALQAFGASYVSQVFSDFSDRLVRELLERDIAPRMIDAYQTALRDSFVRLEQSEAQFEYHGDTHQMIAGTWQLPYKELIQVILRWGFTRLVPQLFFLSDKISEFVYDKLNSAAVWALPKETFVKLTAGHLERVCDESVQQYREMFYQTMLPNIKRSLADWYEAQVRDTALRLRERDDQLRAEFEEGERLYGEWKSQRDALERLIERLRAFCG